MESNAANWTIIGLSSFLIGVSKSGIPGLVTLLTPFVSIAMPVRISTGFLLPMLVAGDIMAVLYWKRRASWNYLFKLLPWTALGVIAGFLLMRNLDDSVFRPVLGVMILTLTLLNAVGRVWKATLKLDSLFFAATAGILAGIFTMFANAAAPIIAIYLLSLGLPKEDFVGTNAWFFLIINVFKLPFSAAMGLITFEYLKLNLTLLPLILLGGVAGILILKRIPQKIFDVGIQILAVAAGLKLLF